MRDVVGQRAQVIEQRPDVQRQVVIGALARILGFGMLGTHRLEHRRNAAGVGLVEELVIEQHGLQALAHLPRSTPACTGTHARAVNGRAWHIGLPIPPKVLPQMGQGSGFALAHVCPVQSGRCRQEKSVQ